MPDARHGRGSRGDDVFLGDEIRGDGVGAFESSKLLLQRLLLGALGEIHGGGASHRAPREAECHADVAADSNGDSVAVTAVTGDVDASFVGERFVEPEPSSLSDISRRSTKRRADVNADASSRRRFDEAAPLGVVSAPPAEPHSSAEDPVDPADSGAREASALVSDSDDPQSERALVAPRDSGARETPALVSDSDDPQSECGLSESRPPRFRRRANGVAMRLKNRRGGVGPGVGLTDVGPGVGLTDVAGVTSALVRSAALWVRISARAPACGESPSPPSPRQMRVRSPWRWDPSPQPYATRRRTIARARQPRAASSSKRRTTSAISSRSTSASFAPRPLQSSNAPVRRVTKRRVVGVAARFSSPVTTRASSRVSRRSP